MLDIEFVHRHFPQLADAPEFTFCSNAGGSYVALPVIERFEHYNRHTRVQPYVNYPASRQAGQAMDYARSRWAQALQVEPSELTFGPSTSTNTYVLAQAIGSQWQPGDEIIVSQQDHEANHGVWRRMAEQQGATLIEWPVDPQSGLLDPDALYPLLTDKTRWLFFPHCSNIVGTINPVAEIARQVRQRSAARICVDGVAYVPHHIPDLSALDVDVYLFSLYKVYGPHQGLMYVNAEVADSVPPQSHYFLGREPTRMFNPSGPQHAEIAASAGVVDYFEQLIEHHASDIQRADHLAADLQALHTLLADHEQQLSGRLLDYLATAPGISVLGKTHCTDQDRAATIAFQTHNCAPAELAAGLQQRNIGAEAGHFYAHRLLTHLGIDPQVGVVRISLVHYNTVADLERIILALDQCLQAAQTTGGETVQAG